MSLDIYLELDITETYLCSCGDEHQRRIRLDFESNLTHNLATMAQKTNPSLYLLMWRPEEQPKYRYVSSDGEEFKVKCELLIADLELAIWDLESRPEYFKQFNPINGWGSYSGLLYEAKRFLQACKLNSEANVIVSR